MEKKFSLEITKLSIDSEVDSAKILFQEGLFEEAKKILFQILLRTPGHAKARTLLEQIQVKEEVQLLRPTLPRSQNKNRPENVSDIIEKLNSDLGLGLDPAQFDPNEENWILDSELSEQGRYDLAVAFFEMGCFKDAMRELKIAERAIRLKQSFLGEFGVAVVALFSECLLGLGNSYEARTYLEPILLEPDLKIEEKLVLFYIMGRVEDRLGNGVQARAWFQKVIDADPTFRDAQSRLAQVK